jgi:Kef-type K+ transport system membrane component KefB
MEFTESAMIPYKNPKRVFQQSVSISKKALFLRFILPGFLMYQLIHHPLPLIVVLMILLLSSKVLGEIFERFGQPSMIGEVLAGVILGPAILNIINSSNELKVIADLGIFLMIAMAGMEINVEDIRNSVRGRHVWIAIFGFIVPFLCGILIGLMFHLNYSLSMFIGLSISITALPVSIRILIDLGKLKTDVGQRIISAAVFNDILALLVLGIILDFNDESRTLGDFMLATTITTLKLTGFILLLIVAYKGFIILKNRVRPLSPRAERILEFIRGRKLHFAVVILFILAYASVAELMGVHLIIGAFFGAILFPRKIFTYQQFEHTKEITEDITMGFLAPIAFAFIGISCVFSVITNWWLLVMILAASFFSKILGGFTGGRLAGFSSSKSLALGFGLNARGMMELVIASIALQKHFIDISLYTILVIMALLTTILTPFFLKKAFRRIDREGSA